MLQTALSASAGFWKWCQPPAKPAIRPRTAAQTGPRGPLLRSPPPKKKPKKNQQPCIFHLQLRVLVFLSLIYEPTLRWTSTLPGSQAFGRPHRIYREGRRPLLRVHLLFCFLNSVAWKPFPKKRRRKKGIKIDTYPAALYNLNVQAAACYAEPPALPLSCSDELEFSPKITTPHCIYCRILPWLAWSPSTSMSTYGNHKTKFQPLRAEERHWDAEFGRERRGRPT